jgi:hypothetical protein
MSPNTHANEFIGKELKYFSQAGFDLDRIHIKVSFGLALAGWRTVATTITVVARHPPGHRLFPSTPSLTPTLSATPPSLPSTRMPLSTRAPSSRPTAH